MRLLRVRRAMGRGVKGLWVVIATGILRGLLGRQGGRYENPCESGVLIHTFYAGNGDPVGRWIRADCLVAFWEGIIVCMY